MKLTLVVVSSQPGGLRRGSEHTFDERGGVIGRNGACDWQLDDPNRAVSGRHAQIGFRDGSFYVTDTSTNGVFLGDSGEPLGRGRSARINPDARLRLGDYVVNARIVDDLDAGRGGPRMSIQPDGRQERRDDTLIGFGGRGDVDPLSSLTGSPGGSRPGPSATRQPRAQRSAADDTLGSFFASAPTPSSNGDDPFADLGRTAAAERTAYGGQRTPDANRSAAAPRSAAPTPPSPAQPAQPAAPRLPDDFDLGAHLSDALTSELNDTPPAWPEPRPAAEPARPRPAAPSPASSSPASAPPAPPAQGAGGNGPIPDHLSWEDLLAPGAAGSPPVSPVAPSSAPASSARSQPLPPMDDIAAPSAQAKPASVARPAAQPEPQASAARSEPPAPASDRTAVPPRARRTPGNLLSDLVTPARGGQPAGAATGGQTLDPVSVLRQRASYRTQVPPVSPPAASAPAPAARPSPSGTAPAGDEAFDAVLRAAGLDPATVAAADKETLALELARTAKAAAQGLADVLAARRLFKEEFRLDQTRIQPEKNNPFKVYGSGEEALKRSASGPEAGFLSLGEAMESGFTELKAHEMAAMSAMQEAIGAILAQLDPASIQAEDASGGFFGRGDGKALWERYKELHAALAHDPESTTRKLMSDHFLRAYEKNLAALKRKDLKR